MNGSLLSLSDHRNGLVLLLALRQQRHQVRPYGVLNTYSYQKMPYSHRACWPRLHLLFSKFRLIEFLT